jgi:hypothetical protein
MGCDTVNLLCPTSRARSSVARLTRARRRTRCSTAEESESEQEEESESLV